MQFFEKKCRMCTEKREINVHMVGNVYVNVRYIADLRE